MTYDTKLAKEAAPKMIRGRGIRSPILSHDGVLGS
jgi:hypothetical protein